MASGSHNDGPVFIAEKNQTQNFFHKMKQKFGRLKNLSWDFTKILRKFYENFKKILWIFFLIPKKISEKFEEISRKCWNFIKLFLGNFIKILTKLLKNLRNFKKIWKHAV